MREGRLRGDKGVREEGVVNPRSYLIRAISLARQELGVISIGFFCLAVTSVSGLILPNYQVPPPTPPSCGTPADAEVGVGVGLTRVRA